MEIKHERIQTLLLALAAEMGQAAAAAIITEKYHQLGGGSLPLVVGSIWNNQQNIYHRWIEGRTQQQRDKIRELVPAIQAVIRAEQKKRNDIQSRVAIANRECVEATNAVLMGSPISMIRKETLEAIDALALMAGVTVHITQAGHYAA